MKSKILLCSIGLTSFSNVIGWIVQPSVHRIQLSLHSTPVEEDTAFSRGVLGQDLSPPSFLLDSLLKSSECDNTNTPPSLNILIQSIRTLFDKNGSDIRGRFVDHSSVGSMASVSHALKQGAMIDDQPMITPLTAYCIGIAFAQTLHTSNIYEETTIVIGRDPRIHGMRLADALARGVESIPNCRAVFANLATTPGCAALCRMKCQGAVMVTASHLPRERNGFKLFSAHEHPSGFSKAAVAALRIPTEAAAIEWFQRGVVPPLSGGGAVMCSQHVQWMPDYSRMLQDAIQAKTATTSEHDSRPLKGLKIVLNAGNGSGGFFQTVLANLGADVSASIHVEPDGTFPNGIPNPEDPAMLEATKVACQSAQADLGIMLDTDADRCGFVVPDRHGVYQPLHRNRLIALLGVIFAEQRPGCAVVTDSVTSEGLTTFLQSKLGLRHVRYLKGYANVIGKARELTESGECEAELAIETSGHCAMRENAYLDDGTYTAVQIVSLLARQRKEDSLLDLIADLEELDEVVELRLNVKSLDRMDEAFGACLKVVEGLCRQPSTSWEIDPDNLEGIRVRFGDSQFFMLRKSLHDPILSMQIEARSSDGAREQVALPLLRALRADGEINSDLLELSALDSY